MHSLAPQPHKIIGTKESVYIRKESNSHRIGLVQQHDKRKCLHKKRVELSQDWFGSPTCMDARRFIALNTNMAAAKSSAYAPYY